MSKKQLIAVTACFALLQSSVARSDGDTVVAIIAHKIAELAQLEGLQAAVTAIIEEMANQQMDKAHEDAQKEIAAQGRVGDAISQTEIDTFNQETVFWMTPDIGTCDRKAAKAQIELASKAQEQVRAKVNSMVASRVRGSSGGGATKIAPLKVHDELFCAQADVERKYCGSVSKYADYDLNAANFIQPKNNSYDPTEKKAAAQFIVNTTVPTPLPQLQPNLSTRSIEVQKFREAHNAYAARLSTANEALSDVFADNSPPDESADSKGIFQLIKEQVEGRAMGEGGAAFTTALTKGGPGTAVRSAAEMESMTNLLLFKIWESERRQQVVLGQLLSVLSHEHMQAQLASRERATVTDAPKN